jgi:quinol monooxygenase YgiN
VIVVLCTYQVAPGLRDAWVAARREQVERTQSEDGCIEYRMSLDGFDPGSVVLVERWRDADALAAHLEVVEANKAAATTPLPPTISRTATVFEAEVLREIDG